MSWIVVLSKKTSMPSLLSCSSHAVSAEQCDISVAKIRCPTGVVKVTACSNGLHGLDTIEPAQHIDSSKVIVGRYRDNPTLDPKTQSALMKCQEWLEAYFKGQSDQLAHLKPNLCPVIFNHGTFRSKVWCVLEEKVTFGNVISYGSLAALCGSPKASQSVGSAMRNNPLSLIVPCHRVIRSSGAIGNYSGGERNDAKVWLLRHEGFLPSETKD